MEASDLHYFCLGVPVSVKLEIQIVGKKHVLTSHVNVQLTFVSFTFHLVSNLFGVSIRTSYSEFGLFSMKMTVLSQEACYADIMPKILIKYKRFQNYGNYFVVKNFSPKMKMLRKFNSNIHLQASWM